MPLENGKKKKKRFIGNIIIKAVESDIGQSKIWFYCSVEDYIYKSRLLFSISAQVGDKWLKVKTTEIQQNTPPKSCIFDRFTINANQIQDESGNLKLEFFEQKKNAGGQR
jgi:hypothetical protein